MRSRPPLRAACLVALAREALAQLPPPPNSPPLPPAPSPPPVLKETTLAFVIFFGVMVVFCAVLALAHCYVGGFVRGKPGPVPKEYLVCDAIFRAVDVDGDGNVDPSELLEYLLSVGELPSVAHELLRKLDVNGDGLISLEEWRTGWLAGMIPVEKEPAAKAEAEEPAAQQQQKGHAVVPSRTRVSP